MHENKKNAKAKEIPQVCAKPLFKTLNMCLTKQTLHPKLGLIVLKRKPSDESKDQGQVTANLRNTKPRTAFFNSDSFKIDLCPRAPSAIP